MKRLRYKIRDFENFDGAIVKKKLKSKEKELI